MATNMTFVDYQTIVPADWLNNVNAFVNGAFWLNNIAALRAVVSTVTGKYPALVRSYYSVTGVPDGGGGLYIYDPSDTTSADNGGTIIVASDGGRWKLQIIQPVTLKQFGAYGNGTIDDSAAIQAAFNWAAAVGGAELYAPLGTYIVNTAVTFNTNVHIKLSGAGMESTIFQSQSTSNPSIFIFNNGTNDLFDFSVSGPAGTPTGGTLITTLVDHRWVRICFRRYYLAGNLQANVGIIDSCTFGTESINGPNSTASIGFLVNGYAGGLDITNQVGYVPTIQPFAGIRIRNAGAVQISNSNIIRQGTNVLVDPPNGSTVSSLMMCNNYIDSAQVYNIQLVPGTGGTVVRTYITQTECSSSASNGIQIDGTNGTVDGVLIVSAQANFCANNGITVLGANAKNIDIIGGSMVQNVGSGLSVNTGASVRATGVFSGGGYGGGGNAIGFFCDGTSQVYLKDCTGFANTSSDYSLPSSAVVINSRGFTSALTGSGVLPSGQTSVVINHNLSGTPSVSNIQITPTVSTGSNPLFVDTTSITSTSFTVRCGSAAGANFNFEWRATCNGAQ